MKSSQSNVLHCCPAFQAVSTKAKARKIPPKRSAVHQACAVGDMEKLKALITEHVDIDCQSADGYTPLYFAVRHNHSAVVEYLLDNGADVSVCNILK